MARVIVEYNIVVGETRPQLIRNVGAAIRDGFEPLGAFVSIHEGFGQAVVRYENGEDGAGIWPTWPSSSAGASSYQARAAARLSERPGEMGGAAE